MKLVFTPEGLRQLRGAWLLLALATLAAAGLAVGGRWYLDHERRERMSASQRLEQAKGRLEVARRERDNLRESADIYRTLLDRGLLLPERRLEMVELVNSLRSRYQLFALEYEIGAQRPLPLAAGRVFPAVDVLSSRVRLRIRALHEGDVLGFVEALTASRQGFFPLERCNMRRIQGAGEVETVQPHVEADCAFEWITLKEKNAGRPG
jgi:hypothetical protein